jgi:hypothetical protein
MSESNGAPATTGRLAQSLAQARDKCKSATKDGYNDYHKYAYATADNVIGGASEALAGSGLALVPVSEELAVLAGSPPIYVLNRTLLLSHSSGESIRIEVKGWPVVPERGRPLDKAFCVALTTSLAYKLRDLLQMPRGEDDDAAAQDDRETPVSAAPAIRQEASPREQALARTEAARQERYGSRPNNPAPAEKPPTVYDRACSFERALVDRGLCGTAELTNHLRAKFKGRWEGEPEDWPEEAMVPVEVACKAFREAVKQRAKPITAQQMDELDAELGRIGGDAWDRLATKMRLPEDFAASQFTQGQFVQAMDILRRVPSQGEVGVA